MPLLFGNTASSGTFSLPVEYLVIAGGGAGGGGQSGGGGAGGYLTSSVEVFGTVEVTVGEGGTCPGINARGLNGSNSVFFGITAIGGGGGGGWEAGVGSNGGSGGGAANANSGGANIPPFSGGTGTAGQGNAGGAMSTYADPYRGGGGGGAGAVGASGNSGSGNGGNGLASSITGTSVTRAGGGGGGQYGGNPPGAGGSGGGAGGGGGRYSGTLVIPVNATANTGGGGGGNDYGYLGTNGGSGVVILAYPNSYSPLSNISAGLTYTYSTASRAGYRVYTFTAGTGTITI